MIQRSKTIIAFALVPIVAALSTAGGRYLWDHWLGGVPRLECPRNIDLGERERGEIAKGRFHIRNSGQGTLIADNFSTSCSCSGVEREIEGRVSSVKSIQLSPGEGIDLLVRVGVTSQPGANQLVNVSFATNDPNYPKWQIEIIVARVAGGYVAEPPAVVFGGFPQGKKPTRTIDLYDNGKPGRTVEEVRSTHPDHFTVTLLPLSEEDRRKVHQPAGKIFARIEVAARSKLPGHFDGEVQISLKDEKSSVLPISVLGDVVSLAESRPTMLVLPRYVGKNPVRSGEVLIFSRSEKPIDVVLDYLPPELNAELRVVSGHPDRRSLNIEWRPSANRKKPPAADSRIRLRVRCEGEETMLEVPVLLAEDRL